MDRILFHMQYKIGGINVISIKAYDCYKRNITTVQELRKVYI